MCAARMQHTCVTCAGVHVCSMYAVQQGSRYICSMYAVYMPNMCSKVADIYACIMYAVLCMHVFCTPHVFVCGMFQFLCMQHT